MRAIEQPAGDRAGHPLGVLRNRAFLALWIGLLVSSVGDWVNYVAMVAVVYGQTHSVLALALLRLFHIVPILLIAPLSGVFVDRWNRKWTLVVSPLVAAAAVGLLAIYHGTVAVFLAYGAITVSLTFFNPAQASALPGLVDEPDLVAANSLAQITSTASIVLGGIAGGLLVSQLGPSLAFLLDALSFIAIALLILPIRFPSSTGPRDRTSVGSELREGIEYLRGAPSVRLIVVAGVVFVFAPATVLTLGYAFVQTALHAGAGAYGRMLGGYGVGSLAGAGLMILLRDRLRHELVFAASGIVLGIGDAALGLATSVPPAAVSYGLAGLGSMGNAVAGVTLLQRLVPDRIRGRIFAVSSTFDHAGAFASTLLVGVGAGLWSPATVISLSGVVAVCMGLFALPLALRSPRT